MSSPNPIECSPHAAWWVGRCTAAALSDGEVVDAFEAGCRACIADQQARYFAVDLSAVGYVTTRALSALLAMHKRQRESGGCLALCGLDPDVARVLRVTRLDRVFDIYANVQTLLTDRPEGRPPAATAPGFGP